MCTMFGQGYEKEDRLWINDIGGHKISEAWEVLKASIMDKKVS